MKPGNYRPIKVGEQFGSWTVLKEDWYDSEKNASFVEVQCKCGAKRVVRKYTIQKGISKKCRTCMGNESFTGYEKLGGYHLNQIQRSARKRNLSYDLKPKELWDLLVQQNFRCALSNEPIELSRTIDNKTKIQTASLDRIDNSKGYTLSNVRWVHKVINQMRSNRTDKEFITWCKKVSNTNKKA
jgi:hypothetical protein